jgi:Nitroreductase family.
VSRAAPHVKIPEWEQVLSAGAAAMSLVLAAHALGYAANWITDGTPTTAAFWRRWASTTTSASRASSISAGRASRPKTGLDQPLNEIATRFTGR